MANVDFTTWTETDPGGVLSVTSSTITGTSVTGTSINWHRVSIDKGAAFYSGDFTFRFGPINISAASSSNSRFGIISLTKDQVPNTWEKFEGSITVLWANTTTNPTLYLYGFNDANTSATVPDYSDTYQGSAVALSTNFYIELSRSGTTVTCKVYSNAYSTLVDTLTITPTDYDYQYVSTAFKWETGTAATVSFTEQNLDLEVSATGLSITSVTPSSFDDGHTGIVIAGSGFGASQGTVKIGGVTQNVTAWGASSITFTAVRGATSLGSSRLDIYPA